MRFHTLPCNSIDISVGEPCVLRQSALAIKSVGIPGVVVTGGTGTVLPLLRPSRARHGIGHLLVRSSPEYLGDGGHIYDGGAAENEFRVGTEMRK